MSIVSYEPLEPRQHGNQLEEPKQGAGTWASPCFATDLLFDLDLFPCGFGETQNTRAGRNLEIYTSNVTFGLMRKQVDQA